MNRRIYIQFFILLLILVIVTSIYLIYFGKSEKNYIKTLEQNTSNKIIEGSDDLISEMKYFSEDNKGNKFEIKSDYGFINPEQSNIISMNKVKAVVYLSNGEKVYINSDKAKYNNINNDTIFYGSVEMNYHDHKINAENLDLSFDKNFVTLYDKVKYNSKISNLTADKVLIDLLSKNTKIQMNDENSNILVRSNLDNGNN
tara:strand:+ start:1062 stop:1661 length:600 start_codon:yes stop_codon:yes gene_type:complete